MLTFDVEGAFDKTRADLIKSATTPVLVSWVPYDLSIRMVIGTLKGYFWEAGVRGPAPKEVA